MVFDTYNSLKSLVNMYIFFAFLYYIANTKYIYILHYHADKLFTKMNHILHNGLLYENENNSSVNNKNNEENNTIVEKVEPKYEDKYLEKMRKMDKEFHLNQEELKMYDELFPKMFKNALESADIKITDIENKLIVYKKDIDDILEQDFMADVEDDEFDTDEYKMILIRDKQDEIKKMENTLEELKKIKLEITEEDIRRNVDEMIKQLQIKKHLERLKNCHIIEKTPLGNVIMLYDQEREIFQYYSDNTIPYRYLEPVGRKYVITFDCRPIFVDMEEELRLAEEKLKEKEENEKREKAKLEEMKNSETINGENNSEVNQKKNVFAKFKSYNKEAGAGKNMVPPQKNSISNKVISNSDEKNEKILLKERANCYSHEGRFANFNLLKKIDKKVTSKKYGMSFAEFKKMQQSQSKNT